MPRKQENCFAKNATKPGKMPAKMPKNAGKCRKMPKKMLKKVRKNAEKSKNFGPTGEKSDVRVHPP